MTWTPTAGMRRAQDLMLEMREAAEACGVQTGSSLYPLYHARVFDLIAEALDQALADGAEQAALEKMTEDEAFAKLRAMTNPPTAPWGDFEHAGAFKNGNGHAPLEIDPAGFFGTKVAADPVVEAREEGPGSGMRQIHGSTDGDTTINIFVDENAVGPSANAALKSLMQEPSVLEPEPSKKRRGRPPGAKGKKAKVKAAKAKKEAAPVAETVAPTVTELSDAPPA